MSNNYGSVSTYNLITGEKHEIAVERRHGSISRNEVSEANRKLEIAIASHRNELDKMRNEPQNTQVEKVDPINVSVKLSLTDFVQSTDWNFVEAYSQTIDNNRYVYFIVSKVFPDAKSKTGLRKWFALVTVSEKRVVRMIGENGGVSLTDVKARLLTLNAIRIDASADEVSCFNIRQTVKPVVILNPADVPDMTSIEKKPATIREYVIFQIEVDNATREVTYMFWDGKDQFIDDIELARTYTKMAAYNMSKAIAKVRGVICKHLHTDHANRLNDANLLKLKKQAREIINANKLDVAPVESEQLIENKPVVADLEPLPVAPVVDVAPVDAKPEIVTVDAASAKPAKKSKKQA